MAERFPTLAMLLCNTASYDVAANFVFSYNNYEEEVKRQPLCHQIAYQNKFMFGYQRMPLKQPDPKEHVICKQ